MASSSIMLRQPSQATLKLRVLSYNVLSSHLATPSNYPNFNPDHLKAENRLPVVIEKLKEEILAHDRNVVVCLQEVSYCWAGELHKFFANEGFHLVTGLYGKPFNGYMGVALAWPTSIYEVMDVDISRLSDKREEGWPREPPREWMDSFLIGLKGAIANSMKFVGLAKKDDDPPEHWSLSNSRVNVILTASLKEKETGKVFSIATYHMPCAYYCPMAMTIHAELSVLHALGIAKKYEAPVVLAGDFNIKPSEPVYELLTTGKMDRGSPFYPSPLYGMEWEPKLPTGMLSAYAAKLGHEPDFTNYAGGKEEDKPFIETLDYIFLSPEWCVESVLDIPSRDHVAGPFPNLDANEPSDHVMIAATLSLKK